MTRHRRQRPQPRIDPGTFPQLPTKPTKAYVAAVVTLAGLVGIHLTTGTAQAIVMALQLVLVVYGVWRAWNRPKLPDRGRNLGGQL